MERGAVRALVFDAFEHDGRRILWAADPLAPWRADDDVPDPLRSEFREFDRWYRVDGESTWFGLSTACGKRPAFVTSRHVEAAALPGPGHGEFVACVGDYASGWQYKLLK